MRRRILGVLAAAFLGTATLTVPPAAAAPAPPKAAVDFTGIVALSNCSGSLVRTPDAADGDPALVLTNGHCYEGGMPSAGQVIKNRASRRTFTLLNPSGQGSLGTLHLRLAGHRRGVRKGHRREQHHQRERRPLHAEQPLRSGRVGHHRPSARTSATHRRPTFWAPASPPAAPSTSPARTA